MRFLLVCAALALGLAPPGLAQVTTQGTITGAGCLTISAAAQSTVVITVVNSSSGSAWSGTMQPEASIQGKTPANLQVTPSTSTTPQSTITANGTYRADVTGYDTFILCGASVTNTAQIYINATPRVSFNTLPPGLAGVGFPPLPSAKIAAIINTGQSASGNVDFYTVSAGHRGTIALSVTNLSGGSVNTTPEVKIGSTYYPVNALSANTNNGTSQFATAFNFYPILEAGQTFSVLTSATGLQFYGYVIEFSNTEPLSSPSVPALASGNNTIYTCPSGHRCYISNVVGTNALLRIMNSSGGTRTYSWNAVPSGGTVGAGNQLQAAFTVTNGTLSSQSGSTPGLGPGDFLSVNSDAGTAGQFCWIMSMITLPQ
jgi:hypothetical protein